VHVASDDFDEGGLEGVALLQSVALRLNEEQELISKYKSNANTVLNYLQMKTHNVVVKYSPHHCYNLKPPCLRVRCLR
jgi:hypothetical protein